MVHTSASHDTYHLHTIHDVIQTVNQPHTLRAVWNILTGEFVRESVLGFVVFLFSISIADCIVGAHFIYYLQIQYTRYIAIEKEYTCNCFWKPDIPWSAVFLRFLVVILRLAAATSVSPHTTNSLRPQ